MKLYPGPLLFLGSTPPSEWLAVGRFRARMSYTAVTGSPFEVPEVKIGEPVEGIYGLTRTNGCWALWELRLSGDESEVEDMLLVNGDVADEAVRAFVRGEWLDKLVGVDNPPSDG